MSPYVRTVRTASGARAVQIVHFSRKGARSIEHIGSAHDDAELAVLKEVARQRLNAGQLSVDLPGLSGMNVAGSGPQAPAGAECVASITFKRMGVLLEALETAWKAVGLDRLDGADEVFRQLVTARLIEPSSKQDSSRVVADAGMINAATRPSTTATAPTEPDAPYAGSIPRSPRPRKPSQERSPSSATASCTCPAPPGASTATWRQEPAPWPGGRATSPTCPTPPLRQSSAPTNRLYNIEKSFAHVQVRPESTPHLPHPRELFRTAGRASPAGCCWAAGWVGWRGWCSPAGCCRAAGWVGWRGWCSRAGRAAGWAVRAGPVG